VTVSSAARPPGRGGSSPSFPPDTLAFLKALARNNRREWFQPRKDAYQAAVRAPMIAFVERLAGDLAVFAPDLVADPRVSIFRVYRDTRFSADKTPYKTNIGAYFPHRGLPKSEGAGLYVEVAPRHVWFGGGLYMPAPKELLAIRQHIAAHHLVLGRILRARAFTRAFGAMTGDTLVRVPRGFPADHPAADWLKHKQFLAGCERPADFATSDRFYSTVAAAFRAAAPLVAFLNEPLVGPTRRPAGGAWTVAAR